MFAVIEKLIESASPDLTDVLFEVAERWVKRHYPESDYAALVISSGDKPPITRMVLTSSASAAQ